MPAGSLNNTPGRPFLARVSSWSPGGGHYVFAAVLLVRLVALTRLTASSFLLPSRGDMFFYNDWALRILHGQWTDHQAFYGLPGYAYLLALLYQIFGYNPFVPGFLQALLEAGTATLLYRIAIRIFKQDGRIIGSLAALGWAFFIPAQAYSVILMPTIWLVFVFWLVIWKVVEKETAPDRSQALWVGLLIGVTATAVATILFLIPLLLAAILLRQPRRAKAAAAASLFLGLAVGTSPCWLHNLFVAHDRVFLSAHAGINFWIGNNPHANGYPRFPPGLRAGQTAMLQDSITAAEEAAGLPLKRSQVSAYWSKQARAFIEERPGPWLRLSVRKFANFWSAFQYDDLSIITNLREQGVLWPGLRFGLVAALAIPGIVLSLRASQGLRWVIAAILLQLASLLSVFITERYRLAAVPGLLLFASFALFKVWQSYCSARYRFVAVYLVLLAASTFLVSLPVRDRSLWALDLYHAGLQALDSKKLDLAQKKLEMAYAYVPENAEINLALGNLWFESRQLSKAEAFYRSALALAPGHKSALSNLGLVALEGGRLAEAIELFRAALAAKGDEAKTHYLLALALSQAGAESEALAEIQLATKMDPRQPEFALLRDRILDKHDGAKESRAEELPPTAQEGER